MRRLMTFLLVLLPAVVLAQSEIAGPVLGSGGGSATSAAHSVHYTIGQPVVGTVATGHHQVDAGFWRPQPTVTATGPDTPSATPGRDRLHPNTPNPFNPSTTISYELAVGGRVRLSVYDVAGHLVTRLVDRNQAAGRHSLTWHGKTSEGTAVASGIYLLVLETPRTQVTQKSVLLK